MCLRAKLLIRVRPLPADQTVGTSIFTLVIAYTPEALVGRCGAPAAPSTVSQELDSARSSVMATITIHNPPVFTLVPCTRGQ